MGYVGKTAGTVEIKVWFLPISSAQVDNFYKQKCRFIQLHRKMSTIIVDQITATVYGGLSS